MLGGYMNVLLYRLPRGENVFTFSHCPHCGRRLRLWELFPLLGWILVKGKCRTCHTKIDFRYVRTELLSVFIVIFFTLIISLANLSLEKSVEHEYLLLLSEKPSENALLLCESLMLLLSVLISLLCYVVIKVVFRRPIRIYQLLIKLLYLIVGVSLYLIIFITVFYSIHIHYNIRLTGDCAEQDIVTIVVLTSAINTIIWVFYFGFLLQRLCRNQCGNGN
jgi:leader peptidase (prepilin peptidase)/N-methyltransferase